MKILYLITKSNWAGAQKYVFDLAVELSKDNEVSVAFGGDGVLKQRLEEKKIKTFQIKRLENSLNVFKLLSSVFEIRRIIKKNKFDLIHINSSFSGLSGILACSFLKIKVVFTGHGWPFNETDSFFKQKLFKFLMQIVIFFSDVTICVSEKTKKDIGGGSLLQNKMVVIYNGIEAVEQVDYPNLDKNYVNILSIGELEVRKGYKYMIEAINILKSDTGVKFKYHIFGDGPKTKEIRDLVAKYKLEEYVILHGRVAQASQYISSFDFFVLPSINEAFPYVILEAGLTGIFILASDVAGLPEVLKYYNNSKMFESKNIVELKDSLKDILESGKYKFVDTESANRIKNEFSLEKMIAKTTSFYL